MQEKHQELFDLREKLKQAEKEQRRAHRRLQQTRVNCHRTSTPPAEKRAFVTAKQRFEDTCLRVRSLEEKRDAVLKKLK